MFVRALTALTTLCVLALPVVAGTPSPQSESKVTKLRRSTVMTYVPEGDRFRRGPALPPGALQLPARILKVSGKGYVLLDAKPGPIWLEKMDVEIHPKLPLNAHCVAGVSTAADTTQAIVRGAGKGCP